MLPTAPSTDSLTVKNARLSTRIKGRNDDIDSFVEKTFQLEVWHCGPPAALPLWTACPDKTDLCARYCPEALKITRKFENCDASSFICSSVSFSLSNLFHFLWKSYTVVFFSIFLQPLTSEQFVSAAQKQEPLRQNPPEQLPSMWWVSRSSSSPRSYLLSCLNSYRICLQCLSGHISKWKEIPKKSSYLQNHDIVKSVFSSRTSS